MTIPNLASILNDITNFSCTSHSINYQCRELNNILLTGSTGFLGKYILEDLLKNTNATIYCLVRGKDHNDIQIKFNRNLTDAGLKLDSKRIILVKGDLSQDNIGISDDILGVLEKTIDSIYHCGAFVHHLHGYQSLRQDVTATKFLVDFSMKNQQKQIHYISTMNISNSDQDIWRPATNLEDIHFHDMGYIQAKWACEKIIYTYIDKGYPFYIYRPGNITGQSDTGYSVPWTNHALLLVKGFLQSTIVPRWNDPVEMTPVNLVSQSIVKISLNTNIAITNTFNLHNSSTLTWTSYIQKVADTLQCTVNFIDPQDWRTKTLPQVQRNNPLIIFQDFYSIEGNKFNYQPEIDFTTETLLQNLGVNYPSSSEYDKLIKVYLIFLKKIKFLN
jgi:thioester reductase-like protein